MAIPKSTKSGIKTLKKKKRVLASAAKTTAKNNATRVAKRVKTATKAVKKAAKKPTAYNKMRAASAVKHKRNAPGAKRKNKF